MKRPMPHAPEPSDHPQDLIHLEAAGHFNAWSGTLSRIERGLSRDTPSLAKSGTGSASKKPKTTISNFRSITYGRSRSTHVRLVQLEMSLRRNHKTAAVVKSRA